MDSAQQIEDALRELGTPERAEQERRYLKSQLEHLGTTVPEIRGVVKPYAKDLSHNGLVALVDELWSKPVHERRMAAVFLLELRVDLLEPDDLALIERLVRDSQGWVYVDGLAGNAASTLLVRFPEAASRLDAWAADDNFWLRRSALLALGGLLKAGAPLDRFARYADAMLEEKEFFIRKAIGWVLREVGKQRPDEVYAWLAPRTGRASGVTMREAVKYLQPEQRDELMLAYKEKRPVG